MNSQLLRVEDGKIFLSKLDNSNYVEATFVKNFGDYRSFTFDLDGDDVEELGKALLSIAKVNKSRKSKK